MQLLLYGTTPAHPAVTPLVIHEQADCVVFHGPLEADGVRQRFERQILLLPATSRWW